nr:hypothetical protein [Bacteroidota bacterium]
MDTIYLLQLNLFAPNIPSSSDTLETILYPKVNGAVRLAPDGKIYFSRGYDNPFVFSYPYPDSMRNYINENLSVINNPNALGSVKLYPSLLPRWQAQVLWVCRIIPNYGLGRLLGSPCDTLRGYNFETPNPYKGGLNATYSIGREKLFVNAQNLNDKPLTMYIRCYWKIKVCKGKAPVGASIRSVGGLGVFGGYFTLDVDCSG